MRLALVTALVGFALLVCGAVKTMRCGETKTSYDINCFMVGIQAEVKSVNNAKDGYTPYRFDPDHCVVSRSDCGGAILYVIGAILSFCANVLYALMWWSEKRHARRIEREVLRGQ